MAFNTQQGLTSAMQGAQLGGKFGGAWGAVGGGLVGLLAGGKARDKEKAMAKQYNDQVVKYAAQDLFDMRRQQNVENTRTAQALASYQANRQTQVSSTVAAMGAADIIGSSATALAQTLDYQTNEAMSEVMTNWETGIENYNTMLDRMQNQRDASLKKHKEGAGLDVGSLISGGVDIYTKYGQGQGANMMDDINTVWDNRSQFGNIAKNVAKHQGYSLIGQLGLTWGAGSKGSKGTIDRLNAEVPEDTMKTFAYGKMGL